MGVFTDDGVSASSKRPEERRGLTKLFDSPNHFDPVLPLTHDWMSRNTDDTLLIDMMAMGAGGARQPEPPEERRVRVTVSVERGSPPTPTPPERRHTIYRAEYLPSDREAEVILVTTPSTLEMQRRGQ